VALGDRSQITIDKQVRLELGLKPGDPRSSGSRMAVS
jgi:hypothetical protein